MKKFLLTSGVAVLAFATIVSAQGAQFNTNLTVGSTGPDVVALQTWLMANGYSIPALASGAAQKGYFGSQTKTAVIAYQAKVGLPNTGFVGPLTRGILNGTASAPVAVNCPAGFICNPIGGGTPSNTPSTSVLDGNDGSATVTTSSYVASTQTLKKGDMDKPIIAETIHATAGKVSVTRLDVHFNSRPWLLFGNLKLKDALTGQVIATKPLSSAADVTEVVVGNDYLVRFSGFSFIVDPTMDRTLVVSADVLSASDKITGQTVTVTTDASSLRTLNGIGISDSAGIAQTNSVILSSTGSTGDLYTSISHTPNAQTSNISTTNTTANVTLGIYDVKLQNQNGTINALNFTIQNNKGYNAKTLFQNVRLYDGSTLIGGAYDLAVNGTVTFTNLTIPLTQDVWKSLTLQADVLATSSSFAASSTLVKSTVVGVDSSYNTITLSNASNVTGNDITFVPNAGLTITGITPVKGTVITAANSTVWGVAYPSISFTINNTGNNPIFVSKTANTALATTTNSGPNASTTVSSTIASNDPTPGDDSSSYAINANTSRTFTYNFTVDNTGGTVASKRITITQINYGTSSGANNALNVNYGLSSAFVQVP